MRRNGKVLEMNNCPRTRGVVEAATKGGRGGRKEGRRGERRGGGKGMAGHRAQPRPRLLTREGTSSVCHAGHTGFS